MWLGSKGNAKTRTVVTASKHPNNDVATAKIENDVKKVEKIMEKTETDKSEKTHHANDSSKEEADGFIPRKGIVNGVQKMSDDSKKDLVIVPKSIIDQLSKKDGRFSIILSARIYYDPFYHIYIPNIVINKFVESDHKLESLKNSIDGLRKMLQAVDNIPSKQYVSN